ncbi:MAG TPA: M28 family metallopeptidase [Spirochaetia bacterium]|nr:M28 family metallopeptidase [Spirochaetia bacterium]
MTADWTHLCKKIGVRLAGTENELRAAEYIRDRLRSAGCAGATLEPFPCRSLRESQVQVSVLDGAVWKPVECAAITGTNSTPGSEPVEGEIVWIEMPEQMPQVTTLRGKIAILVGPLPTDLGLHKRLVKAEPLAVIHVDHRLPFSWVKQDGAYPLWVQKYGFPPTVTIPYREAWDWKRRDARRARVLVRQTLAAADSCNVVAELPGTEPQSGALLLCAHHDTQAANEGADDNASGVVAVLELARALARVPHRRTIRFVSFGTEEQLSVGAAAYAKRHARELDRIALVLNFDSVSSVLGHFVLHRAANPRLSALVESRLLESGLPVVASDEVSPFADHFIFTAQGVGAFWFMRESFPAGRWQHHSVHDNLANVSASELSRLLRAACELIDTLSEAPRALFRYHPSSEVRRRIQTLALELYGVRGRWGT